MMQVGPIGQEELKSFLSLLLPEVGAEIASGQPMLVLGLTDGLPEKRVACGAAAGWLQGRNFILRSLYVAPQHRRWGGGRLLVETLCSLLTGYADSVEVSYTVTRPEHDALSLLLEERSFKREDQSDERIYAVTLEDLKETPFFSADSQPLSTAAQPFSQFSQWSLTQAYKSAAVQDENYLPVPLTDPSVDADVSLAITDGKQIRSFVVFQPVNAHTLTLAWAKSGHPQDLPVLLRSAFARVQKKYPPETLLTIQTINRTSSELISTLIPKAKPVSCMYVRYLDAVTPEGINKREEER